MTEETKDKINNVVHNLMMFPVALAMFPVPVLLPVILICMCIDQPEETPLAIIYFSWLVASLIYFYYDDKRKGRTID